MFLGRNEGSEAIDSEVFVITPWMESIPKMMLGEFCSVMSSPSNCRLAVMKFVLDQRACFRFDVMRA